MFYQQEVIEEIRVGNDIVDVISSYVPLKQKGGGYFGLCPFHNEKTPSFSVTPDKQTFHCFGCGATGNVYSFIMQYENHSFPDAVKILAERIGYTLPVENASQESRRNAEIREQLFALNKVAARYFYQNLKSEEGQEAVRYLDRREVAHKVRVKYGLGYSLPKRNDLLNYLLNSGFAIELLSVSGLVIPDKQGGYFDRFSDRLMFPIFDVQNRIVGFGGRSLGNSEPKYLNSPETPVFDKSRNLYSVNYARQSKAKEWIVVEGYMDVISLYQVGIGNVVAALGTAFNPEHAKLIRRYADSVVVLFDSDRAGTTAALRAIPILVERGLKVRVAQVNEAKDPDEYVKTFGTDRFFELVHHAPGYVTFQVDCLKQQYDLGNNEGKIGFTSEVAKILAKLDNAIERDVYTKEVAAMTDISAESIQTEVGKIAGKPMDSSWIDKQTGQRSVVSAAPKGKGVAHAKRELLYIVATDPMVAHKLKNHLSPDEMGDRDYSRLLALLYDFHKQGRDVFLAEILNYFEDLESQKKVSDIFTAHVVLGDWQQKERVLNDLVATIKRYNIDERLLTVTNETSEAEMAELYERKRNLKALYITISDG